MAHQAGRIRFGLIGCGEIGRQRAAAIAGAPSLSLAAVSDVESDRASALARQYRAQAAADWRELVGRTDVDAVMVSTPPSLHAGMCIAAMEAGKDVLCEKPLARNPEECRAILDAARRTGRYLATGFNYRYFPSALKARELMDSGIIGDLDHIRSYTGYSANDHNHSWIRDVGMMGGGTLRDNGIHLIDLTRYFLGEVAEVAGFASNSAWNFPGCEDNGIGVLRSETGKLASLHASWTEWRGYRFALEIYGTRGVIRCSCFPMLTEVLWSGSFGGKMRRRKFWFPMTHLMEHLKTYRWVGIQSFILEMEDFARARSGGSARIATGHDGLRAIEIADSISAALRSPAPEPAMGARSR